MENTQAAPTVIEITENGNHMQIVDWNRTSIDFGEVAPGSKQAYEFTYVGKSKVINSKSSCGCTSAVASGNKISGVWSIAADFSHSKTDLTPQSQNITATLADGSIQVLRINAKVNKRFKAHK